MSDLYIDNARVLATYSNGIFTVNANVPSFDNFQKACSDSSDGSPEGRNFIIKAVYSDPTYGTVGGEPPYATIRASYSLSGGVKMEVVDTIRSNNGSNSDVSFDEGVSVTLHGVVNADLLNDISEKSTDKRLLDFGQFVGSNWGTYESNHNTTTPLQATSNTLVIPRPDENSSVIVSASGWAFSLRDSVLGSAFDARVQLNYLHIVDGWVNGFSNSNFGGLLMPDDNNMGARSPISFSRILNSNHLNQDGDWELAPFISIISPDVLVTLSQFDLTYQVVS